MKKLVSLLFLISSLFPFSCETAEPAIPEFSLDQADPFTSDEYRVYQTILEPYNRPQLVIRQQTSVFIPDKENLQLFFNLDRLANMEASLYDVYRSANDRIYHLDEKIIVSEGIVKLMSDSEFSYYFDEKDLHKAWELFARKYPQAQQWFFCLNKIGFNESRTQAIVGLESYWYMESPDGSTLQYGMLNYLEKNNNVWELVGTTGYTF